jgi:acyl carrier protein
MWRELLRVRDVGPHDSFFELGGTSLAAFYLLDRIRDELQVAIDPDLLYDTSLTVATLADAVRAARRRA